MNTGEARYQSFGHSVGKVFLSGIARKVLQWQDHERLDARMRRASSVANVDRHPTGCKNCKHGPYARQQHYYRRPTVHPLGRSGCDGCALARLGRLRQGRQSGRSRHSRFSVDRHWRGEAIPFPDHPFDEMGLIRIVAQHHSDLANGCVDALIDSFTCCTIALVSRYSRGSVCIESLPLRPPCASKTGLSRFAPVTETSRTSCHAIASSVAVDSSSMSAWMRFFQKLISFFKTPCTMTGLHVAPTAPCSIEYVSSWIEAESFHRHVGVAWVISWSGLL